MKILDVRTIPLSYRCEKPYMSAAGAQVARQTLLVEIETDTGLVGFGEAGLGVELDPAVVERYRVR